MHKHYTFFDIYGYALKVHLQSLYEKYYELFIYASIHAHRHEFIKYLHCWTATARAQKTLSFPQIITPISIDVKLRYIISTIGCDT